MKDEWLSASAFANVALVDAMYASYLSNPQEVSHSWRRLFQQFDKRHPGRGSDGAHAELRIARLIHRYRSYGHLHARLNPLLQAAPPLPDVLQLDALGFSSDEWGVAFPTLGLLPVREAPLSDIIERLRGIYCDTVGFEYMGLQSPQLEAWLQEQIEQKPRQLSIEEKRMILQQLNRCELFEKFLHTKYVGQKRFSLEGGETLIPILSAVVKASADSGIDSCIIGMAHRGRLNVLSNILDKSYETIFSEFEERYLPDSFEGSGDVKYHKGFNSTLTTADGRAMHVMLCPNPSHLEAVNPVVEGMARALQDQGMATLPILIHGDAAISGQGIVYETLQLYNLAGYTTGGTLHIIINNQIGFTTQPEEGRSTHYCSDIARTFDAPVFHVNGEDPETCVTATLLALTIRQRFHCDVFINLHCYRKYGHNESDEPAYTQPLEYHTIRSKQPVRECYRDTLIRQGVVERHIAEQLEEEFKEKLNQKLDSIRNAESSASPPPYSCAGGAFDYVDVDTRVDIATLARVTEALCTLPKMSIPHKKIATLLEERRSMVISDTPQPLDWGMAELLAYATLLDGGTPVRLAGQDSGRGTFSHRHALITDQESGTVYCPLQQLGRCEIVNSPLSEYAALGFEYGYSLATPNGLTLWEAQFGDFANGAQVIIDQFLVNDEQKWDQSNRLVLLLPHGYEGQGPEHSSARIERFLSLSGNNNIFVAYPTTPAQMFHLLRRQVLAPWRKPLVIFTPKGLLRHPRCVSSLEALSDQTFQEIIDDNVDPTAIETLVFCSGRFYYDLTDARDAYAASSVACVRVEQLCPIDNAAFTAIIDQYSQIKECVWVQEEPLNMGAWTFIRPHLEALLPDTIPLSVIGRPASAASASGSHFLHREGHNAIIETLFNRETHQSRSPQP